MTAAVCRPGYVLADGDRGSVIAHVAHSIPIGIDLKGVRRSRAVVKVIWNSIDIQIGGPSITQVARNREVRVSASVKCASRGDDLSVALKCGGERLVIASREICGDFAPGTKGRIQRAVIEIPRHGEVIAGCSISRNPGDDKLPVGLRG